MQTTIIKNYIQIFNNLWRAFNYFVQSIFLCSFLWVRLNYSTTYHHPLPSTTSQNISTTTHHHSKNGPPPSKSQNLFIYNLLLALFWKFPFLRNTIFFYVTKIFVIKFWSVHFSNSKFLLQFTIFKISLYFKNLRLQD